MTDNIRYDNLYSLLDQEDFDTARKQINVMINELMVKKKKNLPELIELHGFLVDLGCESQSEGDLKQAISFFEKNKESILNKITQSSYFYNLANAKDGLAKIYLSKHSEFPSFEQIKENVQPSIDSYWIAYKNIDIQDDIYLKEKILINLSNSLAKSGRIIEALQFLDIVLRDNPHYPQALVSRGDCLINMIETANCSLTTSLFLQIYKSYIDAINTGILPPSIQARCEKYMNMAVNTIKNYSFDLPDIENEIIETGKEFSKLKEFRKFSINNYLTLNEHAIYCNCLSSMKDDIQLGVPHAGLVGNVIPKLELLLNRIKSEFGLSRWLFYQSYASDNKIDFDIKFSELLDNEMINSEVEMLRTSYRICYGILDKIAVGICKLYNIRLSKIYFESFWEGIKDLQSKKNIHLSALYSIANNLNTKNGELKEFKQWRNKLEHKLLILRKNADTDHDPLGVFEDKEFIDVEEIEEFKNKTMHLLQLTRAAIFSFIYCVRFETISSNSENQRVITIDFKYN